MKKMNPLHSAVLLTGFSLILSLVSCNADRLDEEIQGGTAENIQLTIQTKAPADDPEYQIKSLKVYAFQMGEEPVFYQADPAQLTGNTHTFSMKLRPDTMTDFYVIANESAAGELKLNNSGAAYTLSETSTAADLKNITFAQLPADVAGNGIPMTAIYQTTVVKGTPVSIDNLQRSVAKLNLYFSKKGEGQVYISRGAYLYNAPTYGYLFPKAYDGTAFNHLENQTGISANTDGNHQHNGGIVLSTNWKNDTYKVKTTVLKSSLGNGVNNRTSVNSIPNENNKVNMNPADYYHLQQQTVYIFANPATIPAEGKDNPKASTVKGYYLKMLYRKDYMNEHKQEMTEFSAPTYVCLPAVQANDHVQLFAHISASTFTNIQFNWYISPWNVIDNEVEYN